MRVPSALGVDLGAVFKALASDQRREIVLILSAAGRDVDKTCCGPEEVCACKLSDALGVVPSTISHHMAVLTRAGLVRGRREGQWVYYTLRRDTLAAVARELGGL